MDSKELRTFLQDLTLGQYASVTALAADALPPLVTMLGYSLDQLFFEPATAPGLGWYPDAIVAAARTARPWIVFEVKGSAPRILYQQWQEQIKTFAAATDAHIAVVLSPSILIVHAQGRTRAFLLVELTDKASAEIFELLHAPLEMPGPGSKTKPTPVAPRPRCDEFVIDHAQYSNLLRAVRSARTAHAKGRALEDLVASLFEGLTFATVKYRNLATASSEIDLVIQNVGSRRRFTFFDEYGRYALVECKNWATPVGAKHVRDFVGKLQKTQIRLGFIFALNGITGANCGGDALREVKFAFDASHTLVVVIAEDHLDEVEAGRCFDELLDTEVDRLRFDL